MKFSLLFGGSQLFEQRAQANMSLDAATALIESGHRLAH